MEALAETIIFWILTAIQLSGLLALAHSRLQQRASAGNPGHILLFACLCLVGLAAIFSLTTGTGSWAASVVTLAVMCVGAVIDCGVASHSTEAI